MLLRNTTNLQLSKENLPQMASSSTDGSTTLLVAPEHNLGRPTQRRFRDDLRLIVLCVELALALVVIRQYQLESRTFFNVMLLAFGGFVVHALLPWRFRLSFFAGLSLAALIVAFGPLDGSWLIFLGLLPIGICHLPLRLSLRVLLLVLTGALFAFWRSGLLPRPWSMAIWPILGSMFMFRLAVYLYALKHDESRPTPARTLAYFFMLPNVCFPLFPVVDYSTFRRTYYDGEAPRIYETGVKWIVRGLVHLILYRLVYIHMTGDAIELRSLGELIRFLLLTFLLYLRVSGQFHLITGVLYLYGFRLPETHHLYFLASSFTDFWRRINIYWKDFMMKLVYYPSFFKFKRLGPRTALIWATIIVFLGTWLLHSYQWFWLRGGFPLTMQDGLFWGTLGALVVMGSLREMKSSRRRLRRSASRWSLARALRVVGTFAVICVLWSLWSADSLTLWLLMWRAAGVTSAREIVALIILLLAALAIAGWSWSDRAKNSSTPSYGWVNAAPMLVLIALAVLGWKDLYATGAPAMASMVAAVQHSTLNAHDVALQHKGYYEKLDNNSRMSAHLWEVTSRKPAEWLPLSATAAYRQRSDFLGGDLQPSMKIMFMDQPLTTNSWGMRDRERLLSKSLGVYRIAVLGPSHVMGSGVSDANTFTRVLEQRLNQGGHRNGHFRYEVLNFGVAGYALTQQLAMLYDRVLKFEPDAVFFTDTPRLAVPAIQHLVHTVQLQQTIPFPHFQRLIEQTGVAGLGHAGVPVLFDTGRAALESLGVRTRMPWLEAEQRLRHSVDRVVQLTFDYMSEGVRSRGAVPVFVALDIVTETPRQRVQALDAAAAAGLKVFNLFDIWSGRDPVAFRIAPWDNHPNAAANRLIAERLYQLIRENSAELHVNGIAD